MSVEIFPTQPLLIIDDDNTILCSYEMNLIELGITNFILCNDSRQVLPLLKERKVSMIILDLMMPHVTGQELLLRIKQNYNFIPVIIVSAIDNLKTAVSCMKSGAFDYIVKPIDIRRLKNIINHAVKIGELKDEVEGLKDGILSNQLKYPEIFSQIITMDRKMFSLFKYIEVVAKSPKPILITGESGVGKESIARSVHDASMLKGRFIPVNIGGVDDTVFADTIFGHKRGAFTGAQNERKGLIETAQEGTLFLDEIGELSLTSQVKLLRLIQEKEYYMLGSDTICNSRARIVLATNRDLKKMMSKGQFRQDLYYRLLTHQIHVPPLRERLGDLPLLTDHFIQTAAFALGKKKPAMPGELLPLLSTYSFPGNIRELQSLIFDAVSRHESKVCSLSVFKEYIFKHSRPDTELNKSQTNTEKIISYFGGFPTLKEIEEFFINESLKRAEGRQSIAAQLLGISASTLSRRLKDKTGE